ncbi:MAG TPA: roadblock/LC7 domain-containing protein [Anaerolineales bacterium]|nr:roadblock/LC7 domain-containing protein [Anaerolineales bacterium]
MLTRQSELQRVLSGLAQDLPDAQWVALVDQNGLVVSCVPAEPPVDPDRIAAMTAASAQTAERVLHEVDGGKMRFANITGSSRQHLTVYLSKDRLLSIGLSPDVAAQATIPMLTRWVPELLRVLKMRLVEG